MQGQSFKSWMHDVNVVLDTKFGIDVNELPDTDWNDWFEEGMDVASAAEKAMDQNGWNSFEF